MTRLRERQQRGQILPIFCLLLALLLLPVTALAVDGGTLFSVHATLAGSAQAAAEAAAQAIDVTAIRQDDTYQLCTAPDGGEACGNGVGSVGDVVTEVVRASDSGAFTACADQTADPAGQSLDRASGCAFTVESNCVLDPGTPAAVGEPADGVMVRTWQTVLLPLPVFPGWSSVILKASATAWLQHGFGQSVESATSC
jgi:hypothetical protein